MYTIVVGYTHTITVVAVFCIQVLRVTLDSRLGFHTCTNLLFAVYEIQPCMRQIGSPLIIIQSQTVEVICSLSVQLLLEDFRQ